MKSAYSSFLVAVLFLCFAGVLNAQKESPDGPTQLAPPGTGLVAVDFPGFEGMEAAVAAQLRASRDILYSASKTTGTTNQRLAIAYGNTGSDYHAYSILDTALACYRNAGLLQPNDFRWQHLAGIALAELNRPYEALDAFKRAVEIEPKYVPSHARAGEIYLSLNLIGLATKSFESAAKITPNEPAVLYGLAQIAYEKSEFRSAADLYEKVIDILPRANRVRYSLALAYRKLGQPDKAREQLKLQGPVGVKVADPLLEKVENRKTGARPKLQEAKTAIDAGQFEDAAKIYAEILKSDPNNTTALVNLGVAYSGLKKNAEAITVFEKAIALQPDNINAQYNLGILYNIAGKPLQAVSSFKAVLKSKPNDVTSRLYLAKALRNADLLDESLSEYRRVLAQQPENETALLDLVGLLSVKGKHKELFDALKTAYGKYPSRVQTAAAYAFALANSKDKDLRDGKLALDISQRVFAATKAIEHGMLVTTALAESGKCSDAKELNGLMTKRAEQEKRSDLLPKLKALETTLNNEAGCRP
ncbi:MAG: tetratricopeptide repeat protein [Pyrinomonadaceae bacterium]|nr:tetratricopeptide repeat protein [Pyrinomonadaceae bacterium]